MKILQRLTAVTLLRCLLAVGVCAIPMAMTSAATTSALPNLGDAGDMNLGEERRLGDRIAREIYRDPDYIDDPVVMEYVQGIWQSLLAAARLRGEITPEMDERMAWQIMLGRDRSVNAFALPGGYFGLHLGLVGIVSSRDELASVLAHELSHVTQRHISRSLAKQSQQTPWMIGAMILGILAASKNADAANALLTGSQALAAQNQLNFSRDMEREADRIGFGVMSQAGFEPQGFTGMFEKLQQSTRLTDSGAYPYLRSHPLTTERIADMQVRVPKAALTVLGTTPAQTPLAAMISARARTLANPPPELLHLWQDEANALNFDGLPLPHKMAALTNAILVDIRSRDFAPAQTLLGRLQVLVRGDAATERQTRLLAAELAIAQEDPKRALTILADSVPMQRPELMLIAQAQVRAGQPALAVQHLQPWVVQNPLDGTAWMALSGAYAAAGQTVRSIRAEAEAKVAQVDYTAAVSRFKAAQALIKANGGATEANDHIEASIIDTRTRQVELLVREQLPER